MLFLFIKRIRARKSYSLYGVSLILCSSKPLLMLVMHARYNITIDHTNTAHSSDHSDHSDHSSSSSATDDEDSAGTGVQVAPRSAVEGHEYSDPVEEQDGSWNVVYPDEIGPSDSASRPRTSNQQRPFVEAPRPEEARRPSFRRHISREPARHVPHSRAHRSPPSEPPESVDSHEEWQGYARGPPQHYSRPYVHYAPGYPSPHAYQTYPGPSAMPGGQQQMVPYGFSPYQAPTGAPASYFAHGHHGAPSHEMIPHAQSAAYFPYAPQGYQMPMSMPLSPPIVYPAYGGMYAQPPAPAAPAAPAVTTPPPPPSTSDTSKEDEKFLRLEKLFLEQKAEQKAEQREREAAIEKAAVERAAKAEADAIKAEEIAKAIEKAAKEKAAKAEADAMKAEEIAKASAAAAAAAKEEVKKEHQAAADEKAAKAEADAKKAEEIATASAAAAAAAKAEVEKEHQAAAEAAKEKAAADAAAAAAAKPSPPPKEKDKPIKFKDAIGRRFNFPFDVCNTWSVGYS